MHESSIVAERKSIAAIDTLQHGKDDVVDQGGTKIEEDLQGKRSDRHMAQEIINSSSYQSTSFLLLREKLNSLVGWTMEAMTLHHQTVREHISKWHRLK